MEHFWDDDDKVKVEVLGENLVRRRILSWYGTHVSAMYSLICSSHYTHNMCVVEFLPLGNKDSTNREIPTSIRFSSSWYITFF
jgi:hypothetical protein